MEQSTQTAQKGLIRGIRRWDLVAIAINGIIGAGIFGLPSQVYSLIGPYSLIAFAACALVIGLVVLCFAEVGSRFSETGGPYLYAQVAFGPLAGFEVGWLIWLARLLAFATNCNILIQYLGYFHPGIAEGWPRAMMIILVATSLTAVNVIGVRKAALFSDFFTIGKLIPLILFIMAGIFFLNPRNFSVAAQPEISSFSKSVLLLVYAFTGFEMAIIPAGETREPQRNLPFAILTSMVAVTVIYILIQAICIGTLPELAASKRPLADASERFLGIIGASFITIGVVISIIGNLIVVILAGARMPYAMASASELPRIFAATHNRFHTPHVAIIFTGVIMLALTFPGNIISSLTISAIARLLAYIVTCAGLIAMRRRDKHDLRYKAEFKSPAGIPVAIASLILCVWLLTQISWTDARNAAVATILGLVICYAYRLVRPKPDYEEVVQSSQT